LLSVLVDIKDDTRVCLTTWTPDNVLVSNIVGLGVLGVGVGTTLQVAMHSFEGSPLILQPTIHTDMATLAALEVMDVCGGNDLIT
jgi:hypothetical protein